MSKRWLTPHALSADSGDDFNRLYGPRLGFLEATKPRGPTLNPQTSISNPQQADQGVDAGRAGHVQTPGIRRSVRPPPVPGTVEPAEPESIPAVERFGIHLRTPTSQKRAAVPRPARI